MERTANPGASVGTPTEEQSFHNRVIDLLADGLGRVNDRLDTFEERMREEFHAVRADMRDTCDKGGKEHSEFKRGISQLNRAVHGILTYLKTKEAHRLGQRETVGRIWSTLGWAWDNSAKLAGGAAVIISTLTAVRVFVWPSETAAASSEPPAILEPIDRSRMTATIPETVTNPQPSAPHGQAADWPLELRGSSTWSNTP